MVWKINKAFLFWLVELYTTISDDRIIFYKQLSFGLQISIAKSDLDATKNSNAQLREQLEDYILQVSGDF